MDLQHSPEDMRDIILGALDDNKAEDIVTIDLKGKSSLADFMIIASGRSSRHVIGLSNHIADSLAKGGFDKAKFDGKETGDWVLCDAGDVIIHIFRPEVREFYNIEKIWCDPDFLDQFEAKRSRQKSQHVDA